MGDGAYINIGDKTSLTKGGAHSQQQEYRSGSHKGTSCRSKSHDDGHAHRLPAGMTQLASCITSQQPRIRLPSRLIVPVSVGIDDALATTIGPPPVGSSSFCVVGCTVSTCILLYHNWTTIRHTLQKNTKATSSLGKLRVGDKSVGV